jgi:hypothetical protein
MGLGNFIINCVKLRFSLNTLNEKCHKRPSEHIVLYNEDEIKISDYVIKLEEKHMDKFYNIYNY